MKNKAPSRHRTSLLLFAALGLMPLARAQDCAFKITVTTGCSADGTGWATVTTSYGSGTLEYHWDGNEATGGPRLSGITNDSHYVSISDGITCETIVPFEIDCAVSPPDN